jgi:hypothetical protein
MHTYLVKFYIAMSAQNDTATSAQLREIGAPLGSLEEESSTEGGRAGVSLLGETSYSGPSIGSAAEAFSNSDSEDIRSTVLVMMY